jgi:subtilase family serine protease
MTKTSLGCFFAVVCAALSATAAEPKAIDRGPLLGIEGTAPISVTIALALPGLAEAEKLQQAIYTPGDPEYHHFLTSEQFNKRFGPKDSDVAKAIRVLARYGLSATRTTATTLKVTGMTSDLERAFSVSLHNYEVTAHDNAPGYTFHAPTARPAMPAEFALSVSAIVGLSNRPVFHAMHKSAPPTMRAGPGATTSAKTGNPFGSLTVTDFAGYYDVDPLYAAGMTGSGHTIGIMTLAAFTPSDAYAYWAALGLTVLPNRISVVNVDGGPGAPSDVSGSLETALDVEQSGGIAPQAKIIVYQAPNTNQGFVDLFAAAIDANTADSLSVSWGSWEWFNNNAPVIDPTPPHGIVATTTAIHELLLKASAQGQTVFSASGDGGVYDANYDLGCYGPYSSNVPGSCSLTLSVDYPASDSLITAAGGTTLPGHQVYCLNSTCTPPHVQVQIPKESAWGWDYLSGLCSRLGFDPISCGIFPAGSGGGVSVFSPVPSYQAGIPGIQLSQPGQVFNWNVPIPGLPFTLPANFAGRNVPDVSFNADPETGYVIYYTSSSTGFGADTFWGGTSFVAPQLNGVTALLDQYVGQRIGFLNPLLYGLAASGKAYSKNGPLNAVTAGDNWFYTGSKGYNPATGLGTLDVYNFAQYLHTIF